MRKCDKHDKIQHWQDLEEMSYIFWGGVLAVCRVMNHEIMKVIRSPSPALYLWVRYTNKGP